MRQEPARARAGFKRRLSSPRWDECDSDFSFSSGLLGAAPAFADEAVRTGAAAFGDWRTDAPGVRRLITPADLPAPYATHSTANMSQHEARTEAPKFQRRRRASRSIFSPPGSTCRASFASRRTATSSSPKPEREGCVSFTRQPAPDRRKGRSSPPACSGHTGSLSILRGEIRVSFMSPRRTQLCAFPIAAET